MIAVKLLILHWFVSLFFQSFFLHRYSSHAMFRLNIFWERFFYLLTFLAQGPSFLNPRTYAVMHNQHHKFSDTPNDPHSPIQSINIWQMMLKTYKIYFKILNDTENRKNSLYPTWYKLDKFAESNINILLWLIVYPTVYISLNISPLFYLLLPVHFLLGPIQGAIVNWFGHKIGYRNFNLPDESKNTLPIDLLLMGELYQNNHHKHVKKMNFAHRFFEIDLTYILSYPLVVLGIIKQKEMK
jgi:stearoyl-CoA desaturase (Delta-9 desaturase)